MSNTHKRTAEAVAVGTDVQAQDDPLTTEALRQAMLNSPTICRIATDTKGVIRIFNIGAERLLGYAAAEVIGRMTPVDLHDPQELIARAAALSEELGAPVAPGFDALVRL